MSKTVGEVKLRNVRLSFPDLFVARSFQAGDIPRYRATFLIPKDSEQIKVIEDAIRAVAITAWDKKADSILKAIRGNKNKFCFQDGDNTSYDGYAGHMSLAANKKSKPLVIDRDRTTLTQEDGRPYAGCYVNANITIFAYPTSGNGISASLNGVQFLRDGDAFTGSRPSVVDDFDDLGVEEKEEDYA